MENAGLFDFLNGVSPWWWIAFGIALGVLEMATFSLFLIWPGLAAVAVGLALFLAPGVSGEGQIAIFAVLAVGFTWIGRIFMRRAGQAPSESPNLNARANQMVGRRAVALAAFHSGEGSVAIDGIHWKARASADVAEGAELKVVEAEGVNLVVEPV